MKIPNSRCRSKLILRILLFLQFVGGFFVHLNVYDFFPMTKIEVFPQILESREKKWILIGLLRSVPEKSSLNLTLYIEIALAHSVCLLNIQILNS